MLKFLEFKILILRKLPMIQQKLLTNLTYGPKLETQTLLMVWQYNPSTPVIQKGCDLPARLSLVGRHNTLPSHRMGTFGFGGPKLLNPGM